MSVLLIVERFNAVGSLVTVERFDLILEAVDAAAADDVVAGSRSEGVENMRFLVMVTVASAIAWFCWEVRLVTLALRCRLERRRIRRYQLQTAGASSIALVLLVSALALPALLPRFPQTLDA